MKSLACLMIGITSGFLAAPYVNPPRELPVGVPNTMRIVVFHGEKPIAIRDATLFGSDCQTVGGRKFLDVSFTGKPTYEEAVAGTAVAKARLIEEPDSVAFWNWWLAEQQKADTPQGRYAMLWITTN